MKYGPSNRNKEVGAPGVVSAAGLVVDGGDGPGDADAEEDVDGVGAGHVTHGVVGGLVLDSGGLGGEGIWSHDIIIRWAQLGEIMRNSN